MRQSLIPWAASLALVILAATVAARWPGGAWLAGLLAGGWSPPLWLLLVGWPLFYLAQAGAAARAWSAGGPAAAAGLAAWLAQWPAHAAWNWLAFAQHRTGFALAGLGLEIAFGALALQRFRSLSGVACAVLLGALAWLAFIWWWLFVAWRVSGGGLGSIFA